MIRHYFETKTAIDEERILADLPTGLRHEVSSFLVSDLMSNVDLFKDLGPVKWSRILPLLRPCRFEMNDHMCSQGDPCHEAFVILDGECRAVTMVDPAYFSEPLRNKKFPFSSPAKSVDTPPRSSMVASFSPFSLTKHSSIETNELGSFEFIESIRSSGCVPHNGPRNNKVAPLPYVLAASEFVPPSSATSSSPPSTETSKKNDNIHYRKLEPGGLVNTLCLLQVWEKCLETVVCVNTVETYAINSIEFRNVLGDDSTLQDLTQKIVSV